MECLPLFKTWIQRALNSQSWRLRPEDQRDVEQIALAALSPALERFNGQHPGALRLFIQQIAVNKGIQWLRTLIRKQQPLLSYDDPDFHLGAQEQDPSEDGDVVGCILRSERARMVQECVEKLSPECQEVLLEHYWQGKKYREIAAERQEPMGTVASRLFTCLKKLRVILEKSALWPKEFAVHGDRVNIGTHHETH
jgi:RNA polymerase sigma-70 factor (ECF subfamily)